MAETEKSALARFDGFVPERAAIEAYGNGGFRFAGMSHRGSLLVLADGMHAWPGASSLMSSCTLSNVTVDLSAVLVAVLEHLAAPQFLLLGTGIKQIFPEANVRAVFGARGIGIEAMDTGAACRTYNILLAEHRPVMAALMAVA